MDNFEGFILNQIFIDLMGQQWLLKDIIAHESLRQQKTIFTALLQQKEKESNIVEVNLKDLEKNFLKVQAPRFIEKVLAFEQLLD
jgi:hypothetical protein